MEVDDRTILNSADLYGILGLGRMAIWRWAEKRGLPYRKKDKRNRRYEVGEVRAWLQKNEPTYAALFEARLGLTVPAAQTRALVRATRRLVGAIWSGYKATGKQPVGEFRQLLEEAGQQAMSLEAAIENPPFEPKGW